MKNKLNEIERSILQISRSIVLISIFFILIISICLSIIVVPKKAQNFAKPNLVKGINSDELSLQPTEASQPIVAPKPNSEITAILWEAPSESTIPKGLEGEEILYGKDLIANTAQYLGPKGSVAAISNGMNCQNCHLDAGSRTWGWR